MRNFDYNWQRRVVTAAPLISIVVFLVLWLQFNLAHPGWVVFFFIPLSSYLVGLRKIRITFSFFILITYIILGSTFNWWHPGWILFFLIPIYHILTAPNPKREAEKTKEKTRVVDAEFDAES